MLKNILYQKLMQRIFKSYLSVKFGVKEFIIDENEKCLCLCPHQDDESIGMGGTLAKYNKNFTVVCLTNGAKGLKNLPKKEAIKIRCDEFSSALNKALINNFKILDIEDRYLIDNYEKFSVIDIENYDYIFIPNIIDQHKDHKAVGIHLKKLLSEKKHKETLKICMYEVWATLALPNKSVDIENQIEIKKAMIQSYKSQIQQRDYFNPIIGLNMYRAQQLNKKFVEDFTVLNVKEFNQLIDSIY